MTNSLDDVQVSGEILRFIICLVYQLNQASVLDLDEIETKFANLANGKDTNALTVEVIRQISLLRWGRP